MKSLAGWAILSALLSASSSFAAVPISSVKRVSSSKIVPNKFIVEVDTLAEIPNKRSFTRALDAVYESIRARDIELEVEKEFDSPGVFVGAAVTMHTTQDVVTIENIPGIVAIRPVQFFERPKPVSLHVVKGTDDPALPSDSQSTLKLTGVDKLHAKGIFGKGIKIGILDTGVDYTHPLLGGGIGPGKKIIGGYDFVGDSYNGRNLANPDDDPLDQCAGHGTHVAGIIGTDPKNEYNVSGVAPEASITAYRIFGCTGATQDIIIIEALLRGVEEGQDILTLSLGGAHGWTESTSAVVASRIAESGIIVTIAAGNDGSDGAWYTSSPGNSVDAISVGSLENTVIPLQTAAVHGVGRESITYFSFKPLAVEGEYPIYAISNDTTIPNDACNPLPEDTPDLSGYVVILRRGTCTFVQKLGNIAAKGAKRSLIYDNGTGFTAISSGNFTTALIRPADGQYLVEQFLAGSPLKLSFPQEGGSTFFPSPQGGLMSTFSSYGPSNDFYFKPAISAPGGNILSTLPVPLGSYGVQSGTSMATPFVAGSSALLLSVKGKTLAVARAARDLFETTAQTIPVNHDDGALPQTVAQTGAGLINVYDAIFSTTTVVPGQLVLNDTANFKETQTFMVTNDGDDSKAYSLSHTPAGTALTVKPESIVIALGPVPLSKDFASVSLTPSTFTLAPGESQVVTAHFTPPEGVDASRFPVYSGSIQIAAPGENSRVTYLGLAASLKEKQVIDDTDAFFDDKLPALVDSSGKVQVNPTNYTFLEGDFPLLVWRLVFGSPLVSIDLVEPDIEVTSLNPRGPFPARPHSITFPHRNARGSFAKVNIVGPLVEYGWVSRNNEDEEDNATHTFAFDWPAFANNTAINRGVYRILFRALKVTGDPSKQEDYESWLSPVIGIP